MDTTGRVVAGFGDIDRPFYMRSASKPFQAAVVVDLGVDLPDEHLALVCSSQDATSTHRSIIRAILADGGLTEADLACPPARPGSMSADRMAATAGDTAPSRIMHYCAGKHAGMLRACLAQGWDIDGYLDPGHPLQRAIHSHMSEVGALVDDAIGVDGCGAPVFRVDAASAATAFATLLHPRHDRVWRAMHRFPALVSGSGNVDAVIAVGLDGVAKTGAEGLLAVTVRGRGALAVRCWDGSERAVAATARSALLQLGWVGDRSPLVSALDRPVLGGGRTVGTVRAVFGLEDR